MVEDETISAFYALLGLVSRVLVACLAVLDLTVSAGANCPLRIPCKAIQALIAGIDVTCAHSTILILAYRALTDKTLAIQLETIIARITHCRAFLIACLTFLDQACTIDALGLLRIGRLVEPEIFLASLTDGHIASTVRTVLIGTLKLTLAQLGIKCVISCALITTLTFTESSTK